MWDTMTPPLFVEIFMKKKKHKGRTTILIVFCSPFLNGTLNLYYNGISHLPVFFNSPAEAGCKFDFCVFFVVFFNTQQQMPLYNFALALTQCISIMELIVMYYMDHATSILPCNGALSLVLIFLFLLSKQRSVKFLPPVFVILCFFSELGSPGHAAMFLMDKLKSNW